MRTTAIVNLKGGVGKTVTAINMASILGALHRKHVLLIDADSQHNTTDFLGVDPSGGMVDYLAGTHEPYWVENIVKTEIAGVSLLPGSDDLMDYDIGALRDGRADRQCLVNLFAAISEDNAAEEAETGRELIDHIIVDCPPAFNAASAAALAAVDEVVIPLRLDAYSMAGVANVVRQVDSMRQINPRLRVAGVLLTMYNRNQEAWAEELRGYGRILPVYEQVIRDSRLVSLSTFSGDPLAVFSPHCCAAIDYRRWVNEYLGKEV